MLFTLELDPVLLVDGNDGILVRHLLLQLAERLVADTQSINGFGRNAAMVLRKGVLAVKGGQGRATRRLGG